MIWMGHVARELGRSLYRNPMTALGSFLSLALVFLLFDLFWISAGTVDLFYSELLSQLKMEVFIARDMPESDLEEMQRRIMTMEGVTSVEHVSQKMAREELTRLIGADLLAGKDSANPLPQSFLLTFDGEHLSQFQLEATEDTVLQIPGVSEVFYSRIWLKKAESTKAILGDIGLVLGGLILLTAFLSSINFIRLMTRARARGFQQMLLQGASKWFISLPFLLEGFIVAGVSASLGWLTVWYVHTRIEITVINIVIPPTSETALFCLVAGVVGAISGFLGVRKMVD